MILQHILPDHLQTQLMLLIKSTQIIRKHCRINLAGHRPVILIFMSGFQCTRDEIIHTVSCHNIKPMYVRKIDQRTDFPDSVWSRRCNDDLCLLGIIRRVEFVRCQKNTITSRNLHHTHDSSRTFPYCLFLIALQIKQITWILLFCRYQNMSLSLICKRCNRITFCKI